jgi:hypothetical protein
MRNILVEIWRFLRNDSVNLPNRVEPEQESLDVEDGEHMKENRATEPLKFTALCLLVFYIARRWLIAHYEAKYAGFWGGVDALSNSNR